MATSLAGHLIIKVHPLIKKRNWNKILIREEPERSVFRVSISTTEKKDSLFDWM